MRRVPPFSPLQPRLTGGELPDPDAADVTWHGASRARCGVYRFNTKRKQQLFCPRCGVSLGIDFTGVPGRTDYGISVRGRLFLLSLSFPPVL